MKRYIKYILPLFFFFMIFLIYSRFNNRKSYLIEKNIAFNGVVLKKYKRDSSEKVHRIIFEDFLEYIPPNRFLENVEIGDTLIKKHNAFEYIIKKKGHNGDPVIIHYKPGTSF